MFALALFAVGSGRSDQLERLLREIREDWRTPVTHERAAEEASKNFGTLKFVSGDGNAWRVKSWMEDECTIPDPSSENGVEILAETCGKVEGNAIRFDYTKLEKGSRDVAKAFNEDVKGRAFATEFVRATNVKQPIYNLYQELPSTQKKQMTSRFGKGVGPDYMNMYACGTLWLAKGPKEDETMIYLEEICIGQDAYFKERHNFAGLWNPDKRSGFNEFWFLGWSGGAKVGGGEDDDATVWKKMDDNQIQLEYFSDKCVAHATYMSNSNRASTHPCRMKWINAKGQGCKNANCELPLEATRLDQPGVPLFSMDFGNGAGLGTVLDVVSVKKDKVRLGANKALEMSKADWTCSSGSPFDCFDCENGPICKEGAVPQPGQLKEFTSARFKWNEVFIQAL